MSLAAGKCNRLLCFSYSFEQLRIAAINNSQSIQNNSNDWLESDESTLNELAGVKFMPEYHHIDESRVFLTGLFFDLNTSHFTLFVNMFLIPATGHKFLSGSLQLHHIYAK